MSTPTRKACVMPLTAPSPRPPQPLCQPQQPQQPHPPLVLRTAAIDIQRHDQVAFVSPDGAWGEHVAGAVAAVRRDPRQGAVFVVVENRVHVVPDDHGVVIVRSPAVGIE